MTAAAEALLTSNRESRLTDASFASRLVSGLAAESRLTKGRENHRI